MKIAAQSLGLIAMFVGTWWSWVVWGHESRTLNRLINAGVVSSAHHCRLLYSTGYRHENRHVFECKPGDVLDSDKGGITLGPVDLEDGNMGRHFAERIRPLMDGCIQPPVDWKHAEVCYGDGKGLLSIDYTVKSDGRFFVVLEVF